MDIFKDKTAMPPMDNSPDVVRTAQTFAEFQKDATPAREPNMANSVKCAERPRFGHGY